METYTLLVVLALTTAGTPPSTLPTPWLWQGAGSDRVWTSRTYWTLEDCVTQRRALVESLTALGIPPAHESCTGLRVRAGSFQERVNDVER